MLVDSPSRPFVKIVETESRSTWNNVSRLAESTVYKKVETESRPTRNNVSLRAELTFCKNGRANASTYIVTKIIGSLKKYTALRANRILKRSGAFWQHESYDHVIRDGDELDRTIWYILYNPVKAGMVSEPEQWKWSYYKPELLI